MITAIGVALHVWLITPVLWVTQGIDQFRSEKP